MVKFQRFKLAIYSIMFSRKQKTLLIKLIILLSFVHLIGYVIRVMTVKPGKDIHILVNAYMRGGSSFATDLLVGQPSTFYVYEPLWRFSKWGFYTGDGQLCDTLQPKCSNSNSSTVDLKDIRSYITASTSETPLKTCHRFLHDIYNCHFNETMHDVIQDGITDNLSGSSWEAYRNCKGKRGKLACIPEITRACSESKIRITKVLRLRLDASKSLLEEDTSLKVIQLFRDPRSIICSRLVKTKWYPLKAETSSYHSVVANARSLCDKMLNDYKAGKRLKKQFPNRVRFVRYEDLVHYNKNLVAGDLYKFIGLDRKPGWPTVINTAFDWRKLLNAAVLEIVDTECSDVYKVLGYQYLKENQVVDNSYISFIPEFDINK